MSEPQKLTKKEALAMLDELRRQFECGKHPLFEALAQYIRER